MASDTVTRKLWANAMKQAKRRQKCAMSKCRKEVKIFKELNPVKKEVIKKCDQTECSKYYACAASKELKPMNLTKKRTKGEFIKDFKDWQKQLKKKCGSAKECEKSQKCSRKIYKERGYTKAFSDLIDCKMEKCQLV